MIWAIRWNGGVIIGWGEMFLNFGIIVNWINRGDNRIVRLVGVTRETGAFSLGPY